MTPITDADLAAWRESHARVRTDADLDRWARLAYREWTRLLGALAEARAALAEAVEWVEDDDAGRVAEAAEHLATWRAALGR